MGRKSKETDKVSQNREAIKLQKGLSTGSVLLGMFIMVVILYLLAKYMGMSFF